MNRLFPFLFLLAAWITIAGSLWLAVLLVHNDGGSKFQKRFTLTSAFVASFGLIWPTTESFLYALGARF